MKITTAKLAPVKIMFKNEDSLTPTTKSTSKKEKLLIYIRSKKKWSGINEWKATHILVIIIAKPKAKKSGYGAKPDMFMGIAARMLWLIRKSVNASM
jgi:hypothetical protein